MFSIPLHDNALLAPLEPWQAADFWANIERCRDHISPWVGAGFVPADLDGAQKVLERYTGQATDGRRILGIRWNGTLVGGTMFVDFDAAAGRCELGCWLEESAQGHGWITTAAGLMLDWAFGTRGLHRAEWITVPDNARSVAVARRLGMSLDGTLRQAAPGRRDYQVWSILADEWRSSGKE